MNIHLTGVPIHTRAVQPGSEERIYIKGSPLPAEQDLAQATWCGRILDAMDATDETFFEFLIELFRNLEFHCSIVVKKGETYFLASDIIRSQPLFYGCNGEEYFIADNLDEYQQESGSLVFDPDKMEEFVVSGVVFGNRTVYHDVFGLQAAEIVMIRGREFKAERYYDHVPPAEPAYYENLKTFTNAFNQVFLSVFKRMVRYTPDVNNWVVPLSGGHDSRMIVNYLFRLGIKNVVCYSYGSPGNEQSLVSKLVAEALGYKWHFVEYTDQKWQELHELGIVDDFIGFAFNGTSTPHMQDFLAVYTLKQKGIIKEGDLFVPGHGLDVNVGYYLEHADLACENNEEGVRRAYGVQVHFKSESNVALKTIGSIFSNSRVKTQSFREYLNWQEREAKFIINSVKVYEFFGFRSRLPFWDREIVTFCFGIPPLERIGRNKFYQAEKQGLLTEQLISIPFVIDGVFNRRSVYKRMVKKVIPPGLLSWMVRITGHRVKVNEGLDHMYAQKANTIGEMLEPLADYPEQVQSYIKDYLQRHPYQMDFNFLTSLYTLRKAFDRR